MNDNSSKRMPKNDDALVVFGPPRPNAIVTYLPSSSLSEEDDGSGVNEYIPRVQALLYSIYETTETTQSKKKKKKKKTNGGGGNGDDYHYPPEVVVLVRKNNNDKKSSTSSGLVLPEVRQWYNSRLCTRIITVDGNDDNDDHGDNGDNNNNNNNGNDGLLLHAFGLQQYDTIVSLQPTCLVIQDISHLFREFSSSSSSSSLLSRNLELQNQKNLVDEQDDCTSCLLAAVPKNHHNHKAAEDEFDVSVMVLHPQHSVKEEMLTRMKSSSSAGKVDMFLSSYFSDGFGKLPSHAKLDPCAYNATNQESWEANMTDGGDGDGHVMKPKTLYIVKIENEINSTKLQEEATETTTSEDDNNKTSSSRHVQHLFRTCYEASIQHINDQEEKKKKAKQKELEHHQNQQQKKQNLQSSSSSSPAVATTDPMQIHKLVTKRFKALRREGKSAHDAMKQAQHEYGQSTGDDDDSSKNHGPKPGQQVAAMFGLNMI